MAMITIRDEDSNDDGINDYLAIYSNDYHEPLIGDYRGIELCRINYIPSRADSVERARELANMIADCLRAHGR